MDIPVTNDDLATHRIAFRDDLLREQVFLISGGGSGIGRATAWLAARLGATVIVCGRTEAKLQTVVSAMQERDLAADYAVVDIRDPSSIRKAFDDVIHRYSHIDVLINSAGGQFPQPAIDFSEKGWATVINTNLNGTWHMMQTAAQHWRNTERPGAIVNVVVVQQGLYGVAHTRAARAGVIAVSEAVAVEWAELGIRVNCVAPGAIQTEGWAVYTEQARAKYPRTNPTMRAGSPWEIAEACIYLTSETGGFITGEVLTVDGGGQHWGEIWTGGKPSYYAQATRLWDDDTE